MKSGNKELSEELQILQIMTEENPCGMQQSLLLSIANSVRSLFSHYIINGASREQVAKYFNVDVRTITRWRKEYSDFPKAGHFGHKEISFSWKDIIRWKLKHSKLDNIKESGQK